MARCSGLLVEDWDLHPKVGITLINLLNLNVVFGPERSRLHEADRTPK